MEVVGEFRGLDQERQMFDYFRRHYPHFFPALGLLRRTTCTRQAANLWQVKARLWQHLLRGLRLDRSLSHVGSSRCRSAAARGRAAAAGCGSCRPTDSTRWRSRPASA